MFQFDSLSEFLAMGGHGPFVWISYAISLVVMIYLVISPLQRSRSQLNSVRRQAGIDRLRAREVNDN